MVTIRAAQMSIFSQLEVQKFEEWLLLHLKKFFPRQYKASSERQLRQTIQYGIKRAEAYDVKTRRDVCKYIDLMIVFGRDFDIDDRYPWAREILGRRRNSSAKMRAVLEAAQIHLRNI